MTADLTARTLVEALRTHSGKRPGTTAYTFLADGEDPEESLTYEELDEAARARAVALESAGSPAAMP